LRHPQRLGEIEPLQIVREFGGESAFHVYVGPSSFVGVVGLCRSSVCRSPALPLAGGPSTRAR
jgi:hypothetical protein